MTSIHDPAARPVLDPPAGAATGEQAAGPRCADCETPLVGAYCHGCGQSAAVGADQLTVRRFLAAGTREVSDLDSVLLRTLRTLVLRPGQLTLDYLAGRRARHYSPLKLYVLVSALYLLVAWEPYVAMQDMERMMRASPDFAKLLGAYRGDASAFVAELMERTASYMAYARFLSVAGFALVVALLFRRPKRRYAAHLVFALHYYAFDFGFYVLLLVPLVLARWLTGRWPPSWIMYATLPVLAWYAYATARRVYAASRVRGVLTTIGMLLGDIVITSAGSLLAMAMARASMR